MLSADIRQIAIHGQTRNADKLLRAAASAFCALTRPSRRDINQLDDLARPLYETTSADTRRFVAAVLSQSHTPPPFLLKRLSREPIETAAPLIVRSPALSDVDLIALIGSHGRPHARAIARRPGLNQAIVDLLRLLGDAEIDSVLARQQDSPPRPGDEGAADASPAPGSAAESVRRQLRQMMRGDMPADEAGSATDADQAELPRRLLDRALLPDPASFHRALAEALDIGFAEAARLGGGDALWDLMVALRALGVAETDAFALAALTSRGAVHDAESVRLFFRRYSGIRSDVAAARVAAWRQKPANGDRDSDRAMREAS